MCFTVMFCSLFAPPQLCLVLRGVSFSDVEINLDVFVGGSNPNTSEDVFVSHIASKGIQVVKSEKKL